MVAPVAPEDITEDPAAPDLAAAIKGPLWAAVCTTDLPWVAVCTSAHPWAAECGAGPTGTEAAAAACFL